MVEERLAHYLKGLGHQILDKSKTSINEIIFDVVALNSDGGTLYVKVVEKIESNDVYSPKGDLNRKIDDIARLMKTNNESAQFAIAVPNEQYYKHILNEKLSRMSKNLKAYLIGDSVIEIQAASL